MTFCFFYWCWAVKPSCDISFHQIPYLMVQEPFYLTFLRDWEPQLVKYFKSSIWIYFHQKMSQEIKLLKSDDFRQFTLWRNQNILKVAFVFLFAKKYHFPIYCKNSFIHSMMLMYSSGGGGGPVQKQSSCEKLFRHVKKIFNLVKI